MNRKMTQMLQPSFQLYFVCLILFAAASAFFSLYLAAAEAVVVVLLGLYYRENSRRRRREIAKYIENVTGNMDVATKDTMVNSPLPMVIFRPESDDIIWTNDRFLHLAGEKEHLFDAKLSSVIPDFDTRWLMEGKNECPTEVTFGPRRFLVYGHLVRASGREGGFLATTYWVDVTEFCQVRDQFRGSRPVMAVLLLDNYEDLMKNQTENQRSTIYAEVNARLDAWVAGTGGMLRRMERDRYLLLFEEQYLSRFVDQKFDILDTIHQVVNSSGLAATLSIGIGKDGGSFQELMQYANLSIEMALSRGGDQAVIRNKFTFEFYGGHSTETEKRTKVKSRVMANALSALVSDSSKLFIMGHKMPDMDATGAAVGVCAIARKKGVPAYIIREGGTNPSKPILDKLDQLPEYRGNFLSAQEALVAADSRSLVVVVDTNRPEQVQVPGAAGVLQPGGGHRPPPPGGQLYRETRRLNYHEPYASSASELVTELLQYHGRAQRPPPARRRRPCWRASCWTRRTSPCAPAAAPLRRRPSCAGPAPTPPMSSACSRTTCSDMVCPVRHHPPCGAVPGQHRRLRWCRTTRCDRVAAAQAADELLNIVGISTSFVLFPDGEQIIISGRSMGDTNVQVILEQLGGGEATPPPPADRWRARRWNRWPWS